MKKSKRKKNYVCTVNIKKLDPTWKKSICLFEHVKNAVILFFSKIVFINFGFW